MIVVSSRLVDFSKVGAIYIMCVCIYVCVYIYIYIYIYIIYHYLYAI